MFNLGQLNTVDATTSLSGSSTGNQLYVRQADVTSGALRADAVGRTGVYGRSTDGKAVYGYHSGTGSTPAVWGETVGSGAGVVGRSRGGGPGLQAIVNAGAPPLAVNSSKKVTNVNADRLDGLHANGLGRAARMSTQGSMTLTESSQAYGPAVSITVPHQGLVLANAAVTVRNPNNCTMGCVAVGQIRHVQTGERSTPSKTTVQRAQARPPWPTSA